MRLSLIILSCGLRSFLGSSIYHRESNPNHEDQTAKINQTQGEEECRRM